jgi:hypothetical protein
MPPFKKGRVAAGGGLYLIELKKQKSFSAGELFVPIKL